MKHIKGINEDGEISGMGAIVSAQPSAFAGDVAGSTIGSGDISVPYNTGSGPMQKVQVEMGKNHGPRTGKKSRVKKVDTKAIKQALRDRKNAKPSGRIMSFDNFAKAKTDEITHVDDLPKD